MNEKFPTHHFHAACKRATSIEDTIELIIPESTERDQGYKIVADMECKVSGCRDKAESDLNSPM